MQFNSFIYILLLLPVTVILYYLANLINHKLGKIIIILGGIAFYAYDDYKGALVFLASVLINYLYAYFRHKKGREFGQFLYFPVVANIGLLLWYKYFGNSIMTMFSPMGGSGVAAKLIAPIGISFITFQQIAYIVSVDREDIKECSLIDYLAFITYFPKVLMGPLMEPTDFIEQFNDKDKKKVNFDNIAYGVKIFSFGLFKKLVLADAFSKGVAWGFGFIDSTTSLDWLLIMLFYTLEIYFDFSGYSDMAVGSSLMFNITLPINFDSPYKSLNIRDFWKRWHISLTKFFTKYLYIPMGGSRNGKKATYINTMRIFIISGIWHGANLTFALWGVLHGLFMVFDRMTEKFQEKIFKPVRWALTFVVVNILWLLFRADSIAQWYQILVRVCRLENLTISTDLINSFYLSEFGFFGRLLNLNLSIGNALWVIIFTVGSMLLCVFTENNYKKLNKITVFSLLLAIVAFIWGFLGLGSESTFVYFNF